MNKAKRYLAHTFLAAWFLTSVDAAVPVQSFPATLTLRTKPSGILRGWGGTVSPMDWDGRAMLRDLPSIERTLQKTHATAVRIEFGKGDYYDALTGSVNRNVAATHLLNQIAAIQQAGVETYILSIMTPPASMKLYVTDAGHHELQPNLLREDRQMDFAAFVADIIQEIDRGALPLPHAISVQYRPDISPTAHGCPPTSFQGCFYDSSRWLTTTRALRRALDQKGFSQVRLIGPETYTLEGLRSLGAFPENALIGVSPRRSDVLAAENAPLVLAEKKGRELWVLAVDVAGCRNDREVLLTAFEQMRTALLLWGADYWFWRYLFTWEAGPETLLVGHDCELTLIGHALSYLWKNVSPGSDIHAVDVAGVADTESLGFRNRQRTVIASWNSAANERIILFPNMHDAEVRIFAQDTSPATSRLPTSGLLVIPPHAVAIVVQAQ